MDRAQLQTRLDAYLAAELRILESQDYMVGEGATARRNRRADLEQVRAEIKSLQGQIAAIDALTAGGGRRIYYVR